MTGHPLTRRAVLRGAGAGLGALAFGRALGSAPAGARLLSGTVDAATGAARPGVLQLARVWVSTPAEVARLAAFDDTHARFADGSVEVLLWPGDRARLEASGLRHRITVADLAARDAERRAAEAHLRPAVSADAPGLRDRYRTLGDYEADLLALATAHPDKVRLATLPRTSLEGRDVWVIEIATDVAARDGRPVFYMDGLHHAREWPSGELVIMYAHMLLDEYGTDAQVTRLVDTTRTVLVPVQNPDGFVRSRDALTSAVSTTTPVTVPITISDFEYHRKNMRRHSSLPEELGAGIDTNRNYAFMWGGSGSSSAPDSQTYRGAAAYSEPESENIRDLLAGLQATCVLTHHTYGELCMRPWGALRGQESPDEDLQRELGAQMTGHNGYANIFAWQLYDTAGTSRDWAYAATRSLVWTFEHCRGEFHPTYAATIPDLWARNRPAFLIAHEAAADPAMHAVVTGRFVDTTGAGLPGVTVTVRRTFSTPQAGDRDPVAEVVSTAMAAGHDGAFVYHVNPSTRPTVAMEGGAEAWALVATAADGRVLHTTAVTVGRGERVDLGDVAVPG
jgi:carboxypeptidase T